MNRKADFESPQEDPYEVIRRFRGAVQEQKDQLEEYEMACDLLAFEKNAAVQEANDLKKEVGYLSQRLQQEKLGKSQLNCTGPLSLFQTRVLSKENRLNYSAMSPQLAKIDLASSHLVHLSSPSEGGSRKPIKPRQFIPCEVVFKSKEASRSVKKHSILGESFSENILENMGDYLIEDFMVVSPDILELKRLREGQKEERELIIQEYYFFNFNPVYKNLKAEYLKEVARRAFPLGTVPRRSTIHNYEQFKADLQLEVGSRMSEDYFIFNLKGDLADSEQGKSILGSSNPFQALFAVCLRVPDFIPIRQEKAYQRKEQEVWMVEKVYIILTYFPFFNLHLAILAKIHNTLEPCWYKLQKEEVLARNLQRNLTEAQQSPELNKLIAFLLSKKPELGQPCLHEADYLGTVPALGASSEYCIARFCCGIFFSVFAYEEMLLLVTAVFLEKTIVFASRSESAGTLCALFLATVIGPFKYNQHLILNCDRQKIVNILFEFPFILIASIKKDGDYSNVLKMFIDNNCDRFKGFAGKEQTAPLILVDLDSNSIFHDPQLSSTFEQLILSPSDALREAYLAVNAANSKSFSFPKKMPVEMMARPRNDYEKNEEERRKTHKEYQQKIDNNTSKWPNYRPSQSHCRVLALLTEHIRSFGVNPEYQHDLIVSNRLNREARKEAARRHLHSKHPFRYKFVDCLIESQLYADYLDELERKVEN